MRDVHVGVEVPCARQVVAQLGVSAVLFEVHVGAMPVRAVVRAAGNACEASFLHAVGHFCLQGVVGTVPYVGMGLHSVFLHLAGNDIHNSSHCVRAVEHGGRASQHFHPFCHERLAGIGYRMSEQTHILRMSVYQHHQPSRTSAHASQRDAPGRSVRYAEPHDSSCRGEQAGDLFAQYREQRRTVCTLNLFPSYHGNGHGQVADVCFVSRAGHYYFMERKLACDAGAVALGGQVAGEYQAGCR